MAPMVSDAGVAGRYRFNETGDTLELDLSLTSNRDTLVNMTSPLLEPCWWRAVVAHRLRVPASGALTLDAEKIPTGEVSTPAKAG